MVFLNTKSFSQFSVTINYKSIGVVYRNRGFDTIQVGSGFVVKKGNWVVTAAHVVSKIGDYFYIPYNSEIIYPLTIKKIDKVNDKALLTTTETISNNPLKYLNIPEIKIGDSIFYIGAKIIDTAYYFDVSKIFEIEKVEIPEFSIFTTTMNFEGNAIKGFSGGPVLNRSGEVIGVITYVRNKTLKENEMGNIKYNFINGASFFYDFLPDE
jgi:S1-C subfamily serine protease